MRGMLFKMFSAYCAEIGCESRAENIHTSYVTSAERELRRRGWSKRKKGWTCPDCVKEAKNEKSTPHG